MKLNKFAIRKVLTLALTLSSVVIAALFLTAKSVLFPTASEDSGLSKTLTGVISGSYDVCGLICGLISPILIRKYTLNLNTIYWTNFLGYSTCVAAFGCINFITNSEIFAVLNIIVLGLLGSFGSLVLLVLFPISVNFYPDKRGMISSLLQIFFNVGFLVGPFIATSFNDFHGYYLPFSVIGCTGSVLAIISALAMLPHTRITDTTTTCVKPKSKKESEKTKSETDSVKSNLEQVTEKWKSEVTIQENVAKYPENLTSVRDSDNSNSEKNSENVNSLKDPKNLISEKHPDNSDFKKHPDVLKSARNPENLNSKQGSGNQNSEKDQENLNLEKDLERANLSKDAKSKSTFTILKVFKTPSIILSSVPFIATFLTVGLMRVFLAPLLSDLLQLDESGFDLYFVASPAAALISSPIIGRLSDGSFKWIVYLSCPIFGGLGSALLIYLTTFATNRLAIQICLITALCLFGIGLTSCSVARFVILDDLFYYHDPDDHQKEFRVVLSSWNTNICYLGGRWMGNALIGGVIFDLIGYTGVAFVLASLYALSFACAVMSYATFSSKLKKLIN